jgi:hypothetical protein
MWLNKIDAGISISFTGTKGRNRIISDLIGKIANKVFILI